MVRPKKNEQAFFFIGGKIEDGESPLDAVQRECQEEVGTRPNLDTLRLLGTFDAPAHGTEDTVTMWLYTATLESEPEPSSEIAELRYFDTSMPSEFRNPLSQLILPWLKDKGYLA